MEISSWNFTYYTSNNLGIGDPEMKPCKKKEMYYAKTIDEVMYKSPYKYNLRIPGKLAARDLRYSLALTYANGEEIKEMDKSWKLCNKKKKTLSKKMVYEKLIQYKVCSYKHGGRNFRIVITVFSEEANGNEVIVCRSVSDKFLIKAKKPIANPGINAKNPKRRRENSLDDTVVKKEGVESSELKQPSAKRRKKMGGNDVTDSGKGSEKGVIMMNCYSNCPQYNMFPNLGFTGGSMATGALGNGTFDYFGNNLSNLGGFGKMKSNPEQIKTKIEVNDCNPEYSQGPQLYNYQQPMCDYDFMGSGMDFGGLNDEQMSEMKNFNDALYNFNDELLKSLEKEINENAKKDSSLAPVSLNTTGFGLTPAHQEQSMFRNNILESAMNPDFDFDLSKPIEDTFF